MATTSPLGFRYPALTGVTPNVPRDIQALAEDVQQSIGSLSAGLQEGVLDAGSFEVTQASGGASLTLDIASNTGSGAFVDDDGLSPARVGRYYVPPTAAKSTVTVSAAHATLPRVDAIVVSHAGVVSIVTGTATSGATLDNARDGSHGGAAIPSDALHLADALVPATDTTISNSQIRDRRKWARGAFARITSTTDYSTSAGPLLVDGTNLYPRIECSGVPVVVRLHTNWYATGAGNGLALDLYVDGISTSMLSADTPTSTGIGNQQPFDVQWTILPAAGSHRIGPAFAAESGTVHLYGDAAGPHILTVEEVVRQNTANNSTTSG